MADIIEAILPSGMAVRIAPLTTGDFLAAQQRVAMKLPPSASEGQQNHALTIDYIKTSLRAVAPAGEWFERTGADGKTEPDVDKMLDAAKDWATVSYESMSITGGPHELATLFPVVADFLAITDLVTGTMSPQRGRLGALRGKVRLVSVGK